MANLLIIDDEASIRRSLEMYFTHSGHLVRTVATGRDGVRLFQDTPADVVILDIRLPDLNGLDVLKRIREHAPSAKVIMITAFQDMDTTIEAMKHGAYEYIHKPLDLDEIEQAVEQAVQVLEAERNIALPKDDEATVEREVMIGKSRDMLDIFKTIGIICQNRAPVLITGETGTGKGIIARILHQNSLFNQQPFVTLDCSAVAENLLESELFGHEKGAFTGAHRTHKGKIETAGEGTLFLDEIGELPIQLQIKFLGFLQNSEYMRVGGNQPIRATCRIVAATNRNLADMVAQGSFREDLYYRLKVVTLHIPPLRERIFDIPPLVQHFVRKINRKLNTDVAKVDDEALDAFMAHPWPGNVRELENTLSEIMARARGKVILRDDVATVLPIEGYSRIEDADSYSLAYMEKEHIKKVLLQTAWKRTDAARLLGITLPTLRSKIRKYGIITPDE